MPCAVQYYISTCVCKMICRLFCFFFVTQMLLLLLFAWKEEEDNTGDLFWRENYFGKTFVLILFYIFYISRTFQRKKGAILLHLFFFFLPQQQPQQHHFGIWLLSIMYNSTTSKPNKQQQTTTATRQTNAHHGRKRIVKKKQKTKQHLFVIEKWTTNQIKKSKRTKTLSTAPEYFLFCNNFFTTPALFRAGEHFGKNCCAWTWTYARVGVGLLWFDLQTSDIANQRVGEHSRKTTHFKHRMRLKKIYKNRYTYNGHTI